MSADPSLGLVFIPTGSAAPDFYGGERKGDNRYANSVAAIRAKTGEVAWSFQVVHHDLWDYDVASQPVLIEFGPVEDTSRCGDDEDGIRIRARSKDWQAAVARGGAASAEDPTLPVKRPRRPSHSR